MSELAQTGFGESQRLDCVRMKQELQSRIYEATKEMTRAERDAYREQQAEKFRRRLDFAANFEDLKIWQRARGRGAGELSTPSSPRPRRVGDGNEWRSLNWTCLKPADALAAKEGLR